MIKVNVTELEAGMTIGMLDGVVKVDDVRTVDEVVTVYVSIGKLHFHPVRFRLDQSVEVYDVPSNLRGWYGV